MKKLIMVILCLLPLSAWAQQRVYYPDSAYLDKPVPELAIKWIASQYFGHFAAHMVAVEHKVNEGLNLEHGLGVVMPRDLTEDDPTYFANKSGFKSFTKARFYLDRYSPFTLFAGAELFYNHLSFDRTRTFERPCGTDCSYYEQRTFRVKNSELGFRMNAGLNSSISSRIYVEAEMGVGMRYNNIISNNRPSDFIRFYGRIYPEEASSSNYAFNMNLKLAYLLK